MKIKKTQWKSHKPTESYRILMSEPLESYLWPRHRDSMVFNNVIWFFMVFFCFLWFSFFTLSGIVFYSFHISILCFSFVWISIMFLDFNGFPGQASWNHPKPAEQSRPIEPRPAPIPTYSNWSWQPRTLGFCWLLWSCYSTFLLSVLVSLCLCFSYNVLLQIQSQAMAIDETDGPTTFDEAILQLILHWKFIRFHTNRAWSSWGHSFIDS